MIFPQPPYRLNPCSGLDDVIDRTQKLVESLSQSSGMDSMKVELAIAIHVLALEIKELKSNQAAP